jgi:hypothetical protein
MHRGLATANSVQEPRPSAVASTPVATAIFQPPSAELQTELEQALGNFKSQYASWRPTVRVEVEAGSSTRRQLAAVLGTALEKYSLGSFARGLISVGNAPDAPMTLSFGSADAACAKALHKAINPLIPGEAAFRRDERLPTNMIRLYLNGSPLFATNGQATIR